MVEITAILLGLVLLALALGGQKWLVGLGGLLLGVAALAGVGLLAWVSLPDDSRAVAAAVLGVIDGVRVAPDAAVLALLGIALVGLVFARRGSRPDADETGHVPGAHGAGSIAPSDRRLRGTPPNVRSWPEAD